jgi:hypothetical protein
MEAHAPFARAAAASGRVAARHASVGAHTTPCVTPLRFACAAGVSAHAASVCCGVARCSAQQLSRGGSARRSLRAHVLARPCAHAPAWRLLAEALPCAPTPPLTPAARSAAVCVCGRRRRTLLRVAPPRRAAAALRRGAAARRRRRRRRTLR